MLVGRRLTGWFGTASRGGAGMGAGRRSTTGTGDHAMYSMVLMVAMTGGADVPQGCCFGGFGKGNGCAGYQAAACCPAPVAAPCPAPVAAPCPPPCPAPVAYTGCSGCQGGFGGK